MESKLSSPKTQTMPTILKEVLNDLKEVLVKSLAKEDFKALHVKVFRHSFKHKKDG